MKIDIQGTAAHAGGFKGVSLEGIAGAAHYAAANGHIGTVMEIGNHTVLVLAAKTAEPGVPPLDACVVAFASALEDAPLPPVHPGAKAPNPRIRHLPIPPRPDSAIPYPPNTQNP